MAKKKKGTWVRAAARLSVSATALRRAVDKVPTESEIEAWRGAPPAWLLEMQANCAAQRARQDAERRLAKARDVVFMCDVDEPAFQAAKRNEFDAPDVLAVLDAARADVHATFASFAAALKDGTLDWSDVDARVARSEQAAHDAAVSRAARLARTGLTAQVRPTRSRSQLPRPVQVSSTVAEQFGVVPLPIPPLGPLLALGGVTEEDLAAGWSAAWCVFEHVLVETTALVLTNPVRPVVVIDSGFDVSTASGGVSDVGLVLLDAGIPPCGETMLGHITDDDNPFPSHRPGTAACLLASADGTQHATYASGAGLRAGTWADAVVEPFGDLFAYGKVAVAVALLRVQARSGWNVEFLERTQALVVEEQGWLDDGFDPFDVAVRAVAHLEIEVGFDAARALELFADLDPRELVRWCPPTASDDTIAAADLVGFHIDR